MQHALHFAAGQFFQTSAHNGHAVQKQRNSTQQRGNVCDIHNDTPKNDLPFDPCTSALPAHRACLIRQMLRPAALLRRTAHNDRAWIYYIIFLSCHNKVYFTRKSLFLHYFSVS